MKALTDSFESLRANNLDSIRAKVKRLKVQRAEIAAPSVYIDSRRHDKNRDTTKIDAEIYELENCLPELIESRRLAEKCDDERRLQEDIRALNSYTKPDHVKSALEQTQSLRALLERLDLQGHCRFAVRELNSIEQAIHATLSDYEAAA